jgi:hypothetical protein
MSIKIMTLVWQLNVADSEKLALLALADNANDEGVCWPSMATLARKCGKSDRTVQRSIQSPEEKGHLTREERPGKGFSFEQRSFPGRVGVPTAKRHKIGYGLIITSVEPLEVMNQAKLGKYATDRASRSVG